MGGNQVKRSNRIKNKLPIQLVNVLWAPPILLATLMAFMLGFAFPNYWWIALSVGACSGLLLQTILKGRYAQVRHEATLAAIEQNLDHIKTVLRKKRPLSSTNTPCIIVQDINKQTPDNERSYFVLTDTLSDVDWFNLMATTDQLKDADRIQAIFPSQPNLLSNRSHSHFISPNNTDKPFSFPSQLISFN